MAICFLNCRKSLRINEVFGIILLVIMELLMEKLDDFRVTTALIDVSVAQSKLVLLENFNEKYSKCLKMLCEVTNCIVKEVTTARGINAASEEVSTAKSSDVENSPVHDRFANVEGMHAVPSPMTGNYMPSGPDRELETLESVLEPVVVETQVVSQPKVWSDAPIIEEYESDRDNPQRALMNKGIVDSGCSRHMTGNKAYLAEYQDYNGGLVAFGGSKGYIIGKGKIKTGKLDFEDLPDENQVLHKIPRQNNMYSFNLENIVPSEACEINQANKTTGPKEANHSAVKSLEAKNEGEKPNKNTGLKTNEEPVDQEDQAFLEELERLKRQEKEANDAAEALRNKFAKDTEDLLLQEGATKATNTNTINTASTPDIYDNPNDGIFTNVSYDDEGTMTDFTNLETIVNVSPIPTSRIHSIHPSTQILGDLKSAVQIRSKVNKSSGAHTFEELLQFKIQKVWILVDLPYGKKSIGTKWVYRNKKDERGIVVRNKARIEAIKIFLAFASYMGFIVYYMDVKSSFLYGTIDEEVYVSQPLGFVDPKFPKKVYKVMKALYGLHQAPRAWYATLSTFLLKSRYRRGTIDKTLFIKKDKNDIMLVQVYVDDIIFCSTKRSWCNEFKALMKSRFQMSLWEELNLLFRLQVKQKTDDVFLLRPKKPLTKDEEADDVDIHLYRSMIGSLMYLTASRPNIMYLKGKPKLGLWYPIVSSFDLESYSDSDYAGANLDRKSTTGGCQFLGRRLISWQCKKQTIVATSTTEAEYVVAANCCGQILWIQN
ncbi:putative ribonuclease H-like domain-containing protein [Tanacetum coccineum]